MQLPDLEDALRQAQTRAASEQRASVVQVQQQIGVLAAEQRSLDEQSRQLTPRTSACALTATPGRARRSPPEQPAQQPEAAQEQAETTEARLAELQDTVPQLDEDRRPPAGREHRKRPPD